MIANKRTQPIDAKTQAVESAMETRFKWFYYLVDEAEKNGLDPAFVRKAIHRCGAWHQQTKYPQESDLAAISKVFANDAASKAFEMECVELSKDVMHYRFHYCPAVNAWKELNIPEDKIALFCDLCMEGDRGICDGYADLAMELNETIAKGDAYCDVIFRRK